MKKTALLAATGILLCSLVSAQVPISTMPTWTTQQTGVYSTGMVWRDINGDGYVDVFFSRGNDIVRASNTFYLSQYGTLPTSPSRRRPARSEGWRTAGCRA